MNGSDATRRCHVCGRFGEANNKEEDMQLLCRVHARSCSLCLTTQSQTPFSSAHLRPTLPRRYGSTRGTSRSQMSSAASWLHQTCWTWWCGSSSVDRSNSMEHMVIRG